MTAFLATARQAFRDTFIGGPSLFWLAPAIPMLIFIPEGAQHIAEIQIGMFESREAARATANSPVRWAFGYVKIAGIFLTLLAAVRYWGGAKERWWDPRTIAWKPFLIALAANIAVGAANEAVMLPFDEASGEVVGTIFTLATLPFLVWLIAPLLDDATMTLRRAYTKGWLALVLMVGLAALAYVPGLWLHSQNHRWAIGAPDAAVWALMLWDTLWTALFVTCAGSALGAGYRAVFGEPPAAPSQPDRAAATL